MPEIKLNTLEIFQWKVNPSRRVSYERQNLGAFCFSLAEAISSQALRPPGETRSHVSHQLQPGHSANTVYDNGSIRMHPKWRTLRHCATIVNYLIKFSGSNQRKALLDKQHFLVLIFSFLSPVLLYFPQMYLLFSPEVLRCQRKTPFQSAFSKISSFNRSYTREGKTSATPVSTAQSPRWQRDCGKQVLGTSY